MPETTLLLVSVDMILCILCAIIVLGDLAGNRTLTTWWDNLKLGILIFIICKTHIYILYLQKYDLKYIIVDPQNMISFNLAKKNNPQKVLSLFT